MAGPESQTAPPPLELKTAPTTFVEPGNSEFAMVKVEVPVQLEATNTTAKTSTEITTVLQDFAGGKFDNGKGNIIESDSPAPTAELASPAGAQDIIPANAPEARNAVDVSNSMNEPEQPVESTALVPVNEAITPAAQAETSGTGMPAIPAENLAIAAREQAAEAAESPIERALTPESSLLDQMKKLSEQVDQLTEENAKMRETMNQMMLNSAAELMQLIGALKKYIMGEATAGETLNIITEPSHSGHRAGKKGEAEPAAKAEEKPVAQVEAPKQEAAPLARRNRGRPVRAARQAELRSAGGGGQIEGPRAQKQLEDKPRVVEGEVMDQPLQLESAEMKATRENATEGEFTVRDSTPEEIAEANKPQAEQEIAEGEFTVEEPDLEVEEIPELQIPEGATVFSMTEQQADQLETPQLEDQATKLNIESVPASTPILETVPTTMKVSPAPVAAPANVG